MNIKKISACLLAVIMSSGFVCFAHADGWGESGLCNYRRYGLDAAKFFLYITRDTPYTSWQPWPEKGRLQQSGGPHGAFSTTYVNPAAYESILQAKGMRFGSLIVMENFGPDKRLIHITAKLRIKDYAPEDGDWYWFKFSPDGKALADGKDEDCLVCHREKKENDFIMTAPVKQQRE